MRKRMKISLFAFLLSGFFVLSAPAAEDTPEQIQTLCPLKKKVTIDGIFSPGEWNECACDSVFISRNGGQKVLRDTFLFYGYDDGFFYFCQLGAVPKKPQKLSPDDVLELCLTRPDGRTFRFIFSPEGGRDLPDGVVCSFDLCGKLTLGNGFPSGAKWVLEAAIPWSALELKSAPENEAYRLTVRRLWRNPEETAELNISKLFFGKAAPMASLGAALYSVNARVTGCLVNPMDPARDFDLDIQIKSLEVPHRANRKITVEGGSAGAVSEYFMVGGATDRELNVIVTDRTSDRVIYSRKLNWNVSKGHGFVDPDPPIVMNFGYSPSQHRLIARLETEAPAKFADVVKVEFRIINADDVSVQKVQADKRSGGMYSRDWQCPELPLGTYTLQAELFRENGKTETFRRSFKVMNFDWQNNEIGMDRVVPSPFLPLKYSENEVHALLTGYHASGVFWDRIFSQGENILAGPVSLVFNGKTLKTDGEEWVECAPDRAVRVTGHSADGLKVKAKHEYEFDGMCKTTLTFEPEEGLTVTSLYIDIPLKPEIARLYHHTGFGIRSNPSDWIPQGGGAVWRLPWAMLKYPSYIWFGETFKGVCFFTDMTPPFFDGREGFASHELLRTGDAVTLRIHLAPPGEMKFRPFEYVCGFQATPVKPRPKGFRRYCSGFWLEKLPNTFMYFLVAWNKHFFSHYLLGQPFVPCGNDSAWLDYIFSGEQNNESREQIMERIRRLLKKHDLTDEKWSALFGGGHDSIPLTTRMRQGAIFSRNKSLGLYLNPRAGGRCWAESEMYDAEWMYSGCFQPTDSQYNRHPVKSYVDMLLFKTRRFLRQYPRCRGLYYDNLYPSRKSSPFWGAREVSPGKYTFTGDIFAIRELVKRTLVMTEQEKRFLPTDPACAWLIGHMTDANIVPVMGLLSATFNWEMKFGRQDYPERFPEAFHLVQSLGTQTGTVPFGIVFTGGSKEERLHQQRTLYAVAFAFDMLNFNDSGSREEEIGPFFNAMQNLVRGFGYGMDDVEHFPGYEPGKNPVTCSPGTVRITTLKRKDGELMLLIGNLGEAAKVKLTFRGIDVSGLRNAETGEEISQGEFDLPKHDCAVLTGKWSGAKDHTPLCP